MPSIVTKILALLAQEFPQLIGLVHQFMQSNGRAPTADELSQLAASFEADLAAADAAIASAAGPHPNDGGPGSGSGGGPH